MRSKKIRNIFLLLIVVTLFVGYFSVARYRSTVAMSNEVTVALMANNVSTTLTNLTGYPGYSTIIPIVIQNSNEGAVCEVSEKFTVHISKKFSDNIPLEFSLCKDKFCNETYWLNEIGVYEDDSFVFKAGIKEQKEVFLKISWKEENNTSAYSTEIDYLNLDIAVEQTN